MESTQHSRSNPLPLQMIYGAGGVGGSLDRQSFRDKNSITSNFRQWICYYWQSNPEHAERPGYQRATRAIDCVKNQATVECWEDLFCWSSFLSCCFKGLGHFSEGNWQKSVKKVRGSQLCTHESEWCACVQRVCHIKSPFSLSVNESSVRFASSAPCTLITS